MGEDFEMPGETTARIMRDILPPEHTDLPGSIVLLLRLRETGRRLEVEIPQYRGLVAQARHEQYMVESTYPQMMEGRNEVVRQAILPFLALEERYQAILEMKQATTTLIQLLTYPVIDGDNGGPIRELVESIERRNALRTMEAHLEHFGARFEEGNPVGRMSDLPFPAPQ
jgi:hypothetical protein